MLQLIRDGDDLMRASFKERVGLGPWAMRRRTHGVD